MRMRRRISPPQVVRERSADAPSALSVHRPAARRLGVLAGGAACVAGAADGSLAALADQARVEAADAFEDRLRGRLGLLLRRLVHLIEPERLAELDRYLGELEPLPV